MSLTLLLTLLTAEPSYSLMVSRRVGVTAEQANELCDALGRELSKRDLGLGVQIPPPNFRAQLQESGLGDPSICAGAAACASDFGRGAKLDTVIALQMAKVGGQIAIDASVVRVAGAEVLAAPSQLLKLSAIEKGFAQLSNQIANALRARAESGDTKNPKVSLTPPIEDSQVPSAAIQPSTQPSTVKKWLRISSYIAAGLGVVAAGTGITFGIMARQQATALLGTDPMYDQKRATAFAWAQRADVMYISAGGLAAVAVALFVFSVFHD